MQANRWIRYAVTALAAVLGVPIAANWQAISDRMGWSTAIADVVLPKSGPKPVAEAVASPLFLVTFLLVSGIAIGIWLDTAVRALDRKRMSKRWWEGHQAFSIRVFACLVAGVKHDGYVNSEKARAVADEIRGLVNSGHTPLLLEIEGVEQKPRTLIDAYARGLSHPYPKKDVTDEAVIGKRSLESIARARKWDLPWQIPPKLPNSLGEQPAPKVGLEGRPDDMFGSLKGLGGLLGPKEWKDDRS